MRVDRGKEECVVAATPAATHHARHFFPTNRIHKYYIRYVCTVRQILVARTPLLMPRHREEQLLDTAIAPVAGSLLSSSAVSSGRMLGSGFPNGELGSCRCASA